MPLKCHVHSLSILAAFSRWTWVSRNQKVSTSDVTGAEDDAGGADNWSYETCKASVKSSPTTNQHPVFAGRMSFQLPMVFHKFDYHYLYYKGIQSAKKCCTSNHQRFSFWRPWKTQSNLGWTPKNRLVKRTPKVLAAAAAAAAVAALVVLVTDLKTSTNLPIWATLKCN